ncbi:hypothetical protein [Rhizobium leguminosarum]|uniref:hypothetical protein n=1 Tax=Rhizobium leguminosarum TaxID=384 RepID=UPI001C909BB7|nr:hypothetical protein [Rhizobium leguminosarum]MBY2998413.1 hypothetical protein [Rhizobium leguminosarum]
MSENARYTPEGVDLAVIKTHLSLVLAGTYDKRAVYAGAGSGGGRSSAISCKMAAKSILDTATSVS